MFCQTEREIALYDLLVQRFPDKHPQLLELIAWCGINRPERLQELFERHKDDTESTLIDLADLDIKALCPAPTQITVDHDNL